MISLLLICLGNGLWLAGLIGLALGGLGLWVRARDVVKLVNLLSLATGGVPRGLGLYLYRLAEPRDRTSLAGALALAAGAALMALGAAAIRAGTAP